RDRTAGGTNKTTLPASLWSPRDRRRLEIPDRFGALDCETDQGGRFPVSLCGPASRICSHGCLSGLYADGENFPLSVWNRIPPKDAGIDSGGSGRRKNWDGAGPDYPLLFPL